MIHLDIVLRDGSSGAPDEALTVDVRSLAAGIFIVTRDQLEAVVLPQDEFWRTAPVADQLWAEMTGGTGSTPTNEELELSSDGRGVATAFVLIESPPRDASGKAVASTVLIETAEDSQSLTLTPMGVGADR